MDKEAPKSQTQDIQSAVSLHQQGRLDEAEQAYRDILRQNPNNFDASHLLGAIFLQKGDAAGAIVQIGLALQIKPKISTAHLNLGNAQRRMGQNEAAIESYDRAIALEPQLANAFLQKGMALRMLSRLDEALANYDRAIDLQQQSAETFFSRGMLLMNMRRHPEAVDSLDKALSLRPDFTQALVARGNALFSLQKYDEALASYDKALQLNPRLADAWNNRGNTLQRLKRKDDALDSYRRALSVKPNYAEACNNMASVYMEMARFDEAVKNYDKALSINPDYHFAEGARLYAKLSSCDWNDFDPSCDRFLAGLRAGKPVTTPFTVTCIPGATAEDQLRATRLYGSMKYPPSPPLWKGERYRHDKIRIAYLSADFYEHATAYLLAGVFEAHDRARIDVTAISFGQNDGSRTRGRLAAAFDDFVDARQMSDADVARLIREKEIDIAIDLKGFTRDGRMGIFAWRPAPVQVNYLGYPGTSGLPYMDYIVADKVVIPPEQQPQYAEKVVYLPDCYQPNDNSRAIAAETPSRSDLGLPENAFVFCSFNKCYKITPQIFGIWMRLLGAVEGSVLWLLEPEDNAAVANLCREAQARGVAPGRLIFAPRVKAEDHLARHAQADLFLDTLPCNAHTTASDALWAGLPVLTCAGQTFAGRVAASIVTSAGLPELVTHTLADYEALALKLAQNPAELGAMRAKLGKNRDNCPLFDTERYTRNLEAAYEGMWDECQKADK
ncbi:MAG: tetratricopeptide repeat protein [Alphaproteobacteria bacterium]